MSMRCSRRRVSIELEVPNMVNLPLDGELCETLVSEAHECNYCHGQGEVLRMDAEGMEWEYQKCPVCQGLGELDAEVTIRWRVRINNNTNN